MYSGVKETFNQIANKYDARRRQLIPCFDDFYQLAVEQIPFGPHESFQAVDLGAGTGLLSAFVRQGFPKARVILMDFAGQMIEKAKERFAEDDNIAFKLGDYARDALPAGSHVIMSALSIHHLSDNDKEFLYHRIYRALPEGGIFINADLILSATPACEKRNLSVWEEKSRALGLQDEDEASWKTRQAQDRYALLENQLQWLRDAGFIDVDCVYRYYKFAVFAGRKAG